MAVLGICFGCVVIALVFTMVNTAIPTIQGQLQLPISSLQWMMAAFGLINCAFLVTCGRLADIFGRKRVFLFGVLSSGLGVLIAGFSQNAMGLILGMSFAGLGNAILLPVSQALLVSEFSPERKKDAIGLWASSIGGAMAAGPVLGGLITSGMGWRWVFWINLPFMLLSFLLTFFYARESRNQQDPPDVDVKGMGFLAVSLVSFVLLFTEYRHFNGWVLLMLGLVGVISAVFLMKHERRFKAPIISQKVYKDRVFLSASLSSFCLVFFVWAIFFLLPIYLQNVLHLSAFSSGLMMLWITLPVAFLSPLIAKLYRAGRAWFVTLAGFIFLIGFCLLQLGYSPTTSLLTVSIANLLFGLGYSLIWGPTATVAVSCFPAHQSGIASGTFITIQELGGTFGLAIIVSTFAGFSDLSQGFHASVAFLLAISMIGSFLSLLMKSKDLPDTAPSQIH